MSVFTQNRFDTQGATLKGTLDNAQSAQLTSVIVADGVTTPFVPGQFVKATGIKDNKVVVDAITADTDQAFGVVVYSYGRNSDVEGVAGELIEVAELLTNETIIVEAGGAIAAIDTAVEVSADGLQVNAQSSGKIVGYARNIAAAATDLIAIRLNRGQ